MATLALSLFCRTRARGAILARPLHHRPQSYRGFKTLLTPLCDTEAQTQLENHQNVKGTEETLPDIPEEQRPATIGRHICLQEYDKVLQYKAQWAEPNITLRNQYIMMFLVSNPAAAEEEFSQAIESDQADATTVYLFELYISQFATYYKYENIAHIFEKFRTQRTLSVETQMIMLRFYIGKHKAADVNNLFSSIKQISTIPVKTYASLIQFFLTHNFFDLAHELFEEAEETDLPIHSKAELYEALIRGYTFLKQSDDVMQIVSKMKDLSVPVSTQSYRAIIEMYLHLKETHQVVGVLETMKSNNVWADMPIYKAIIHSQVTKSKEPKIKEE